jgi:hypothetical protein
MSQLKVNAKVVTSSGNPYCTVSDEYLATDEAAHFLRQNRVNVTARGLEQRRHRHRAPAFVKIGFAIRYRKSDLRAFIKSLD